MNNIYQKYKTDQTKELEGTEVEIDDGQFVTLARWMNDNHKAELKRLQLPFKNILANGREIPEKKNLSIHIEAISTTILLGWRGTMFTDENGEPLPYSQKNAQKILTDLKDFRDLITFQSGQMDNFRKEVVASAVGESSTDSAGSETGQAS